MTPSTVTQSKRNTSLPGVPRRPLTPAQQLEAVRLAQGQAEQRIELGMQLFKAAEAHTSQRRGLLDRIKIEQQALRQHLQADLAENLQRYEHRIESIDDTVANKIESLQNSLDQLQKQWSEAENRIESLLSRAQNLLEQAGTKLDPSPPPPLKLAQERPSAKQPSTPAPLSLAPPPPPPAAEMPREVEVKKTACSDDIASPEKSTNAKPLGTNQKQFFTDVIHRLNEQQNDSSPDDDETDPPRPAA